MNTNQLELEKLLSKTPFTISYHFDMAELLLMEDDEVQKDGEIFTIFDEIFELYPLNRYLYDEWFNLLKTCTNQYKCMVSNIKLYKGGIIDTYEGVTFEIKPLELVNDGKAIVPAHIEEVKNYFDL
jgi:hypothetical protein